ncbi:MAG: carbohydrate-binding domain-containing protein [Bacteroidaceae bacterium]|nr:carbohydrate-binding domain-containing protein [Bacteroidaceae bacterium]
MRNRFFLIACLLVAAGNICAQHNVYLNESNRTRIVNGVDSIAFGSEQATLWSGTTSCSFSVPAVSRMSLKEKDSWRTKVMPERFLADFDYDIAFANEDRERGAAEPEVSDETSPLYDDFAAHSTWTKTVRIAFDGNSVSVEGDTDSLSIQKDGAHLTITTAATGVRYILSGRSGNGGLKLYSERKALVVLNGVDLTNPKGPVINSQLKRRLFLELAEGTVNTLTDGATYNKVEGEDQRGCVFAEGKLCISGRGQLRVDGNKKCGIASDKYVHLMDGFVRINAHAQKGKALYGKDGVLIGGGVLQALSDGAAGKRIPEVKTEDEHEQKVEAAASPKGIKSAGNITFDSGRVYVRCSGGAAAEGIEAKKEIRVNGGKIRSYCVDDGMNAEGCYIRGGDVMVCSTENDGFDVSYLYLFGGSLYTIGGDVDQMGLDTDGKTFIVNGGELVGLGARNCQPYESSGQPSVLCYVKKHVAGLALADSEGRVIRSIPAPETYGIVCVLLSNGDIEMGGHYKILSYEHSLDDAPVTEYDFTVESMSTVLGSFR